MRPIPLTEGAWQRKRTNAAIAGARQLLGADSIIEQVKADSTELEQNTVFAQQRLFSPERYRESFNILNAP